MATLGLYGLLIGVSLCKGLYRRYPGFYFYLTLTTSLELLRFYVYTFDAQDYLSLYWWTQFLIVAAGFGVTWEIFGLTLRYYSGVRRFARGVVTFVFSVLAVQFAVSAVTGNFTKSVMGLQRNMHAVEVTLLLSLVMLIIYYGILLGRNLFGIILGYGLYLTSNMAMLTLHTVLGPTAQYWLDPLRQGCEILAALIWCVTLWQVHPNPIPDARELDADYDVWATRTANVFARTRAAIMRMLTA